MNTERVNFAACILNGKILAVGGGRNFYVHPMASIQGKILYNDLMESSGPAMRNIDLSTFDQGIYFIAIRNRDFTLTKKIIKY